MNRKWMLVLAGLFLITILVTACSVPITWLYPSTPNREFITLIIPIQVKGFSKDAILRVGLWNAEQLAANEKNALCTISYDAQTGNENVQCPDGVEYHEVMPGEFTIPIRDIRTTITITSKSIRMGEKYMIQISGLSNDNCNSASASFSSMANSKTITVEDLTWATTMMACP
jgi:hypothetical protein